jgi:hypothetical protein
MAGLAAHQRRPPCTSDNPGAVRYPRAIKLPLTAMPDLGVTELDARDMAAFLATLD